MTLEEIRTFAEHGGQGLFFAEDELKKLIERASQNEKKTAEALADGKTEEYAKLLAEKDIIAEQIKRRRDAISQYPKYTTRDEVVGSFNAAAEAYNRDYRQKMIAYHEGKKKLYEQFRALYESRKKMLDNRYIVNMLVNPDTRAAAMGIADNRLVKLENIEIDPYRPTLKYREVRTLSDIAFFIEAGLANVNEQNDMNRVFNS